MLHTYSYSVLNYPSPLWITPVKWLQLHHEEFKTDTRKKFLAGRVLNVRMSYSGQSAPKLGITSREGLKAAEILFCFQG